MNGVCSRLGWIELMPLIFDCDSYDDDILFVPRVKRRLAFEDQCFAYKKRAVQPFKQSLRWFLHSNCFASSSSSSNDCWFCFFPFFLVKMQKAALNHHPHDN